MGARQYICSTIVLYMYELLIFLFFFGRGGVGYPGAVLAVWRGMPGAGCPWWGGEPMGVGYHAREARQGAVRISIAPRERIWPKPRLHSPIVFALSYTFWDS